MPSTFLTPPNLALLLIALAFLAMGVVALRSPASLGRYFDQDFVSVNSRNEVRAVYGGFGVAMALVLWLALAVDRLRPGIVTCVAFALAGMALGRIVSAVVERPRGWPWVFFAIEAAGALALGATLA
jgi:hypothetical protein